MRHFNEQVSPDIVLEYNCKINENSMMGSPGPAICESWRLNHQIRESFSHTHTINAYSSPQVTSSATEYGKPLQLDNFRNSLTEPLLVERIGSVTFWPVSARRG